MNRPSTCKAWDEQKTMLKQKFASLTNDDLILAAGKNEELLAKLEVILGKSKQEITKIISSL